MSQASCVFDKVAKKKKRGRKCMYAKCEHYQNTHKCKFKRLPKNPIECSVWLLLCGIDSVTPKRVTAHMFICSCHFPNDAVRGARPFEFIELYDDEDQPQSNCDLNDKEMDDNDSLKAKPVTEKGGRSLDSGVFSSDSPQKRTIDMVSISTQLEASEPPLKRTIADVTPSTRLAMESLMSLTEAGEPPLKRTMADVTPSTRLVIDSLLSLPCSEVMQVETNSVQMETAEDNLIVFDPQINFIIQPDNSNPEILEGEQLHLETSGVTSVRDSTVKITRKRLSFTPKSKMWKLMGTSSRKKKKVQKRKLLKYYTSKAGTDSEITPPAANRIPSHGSSGPSTARSTVSGVNPLKPLQRQSTMTSFGEEANQFFEDEDIRFPPTQVHVSAKTSKDSAQVRSIGVQCDPEPDKEKEKEAPRRPKKRNSLCFTITYEKCRTLKESEFEFFTGVTQTVFEIVYEFLGGDEVCNKLKYQYNRKTPSTRTKNVADEEREMHAKDKLLLTLIRLRRGIPLRDLSVVFSISEPWASRIFFTWIRFMAIQFSRLDKYMFVSAETQERNKPKCFEPFKNLRVVIDATELKIQKPKHFQQQSNTYSNYKSCNTVKFLIGISCYGGLCFISEAYEGTISDRKILLKSGLLDHLVEGDAVMADRGFDVEDIFNEIGVDLVIPPFVGKGKKNIPFTARELVGTKMIASSRIHVEIFIGKIKQFRLLRFCVSNLLLPYISDVMKVCAHLVNFKAPFINFDQE